MTTQTRILLAGTPSTAVEVATKLHEAGYIVAGSLCPFPKPVGRKKILTPSELEKWTLAHRMPVQHVDRSYFQNDRTTELESMFGEIDLLVCADFGYLIPAWLLRLPKHGSLNLHPSLLPRWRGATPVPFTLLYGDPSTGITVIQMNEKFDVGGVVAQEVVEVLPDDTTPTLLNRCFQIGARLLVDVLPTYLNGKLKPTAQPKDSQTPVARRFTRDDGFIPIEALEELARDGSSTFEVPLLKEQALPTTTTNAINMIRALTPWPGTWTTLHDGKRMKILTVSKKDDCLILEKIQHEGKAPTTFDGVL